MPKELLTSGQTSTALPGNRGASGARGNITFFSTEKESTESTAIIFTYNGDVYSIKNTFGSEYPTVGDYIMFANPTSNEVSMFIIERTNGYNVSVSFIDKIVIQHNIADMSPTDIIITASGTTGSLPIMASMKEIAMKEPGEQKLDPYKYTLGSNTNIKFSFKTKVVSGTLGKYRITLEFITPNTSPAMDSVISTKFNRSDVKDKYDRLGALDVCTYRGYPYMYDRERCDGSDKYPHFDDEKLDNFELIIKDYDEGIGSQEFTKIVNMQSSVILNEENKYKCYAYIYIPSTSGLSAKCIIGEINIQDILN